MRYSLQHKPKQQGQRHNKSEYNYKKLQACKYNYPITYDLALRSSPIPD